MSDGPIDKEPSEAASVCGGTLAILNGVAVAFSATTLYLDVSPSYGVEESKAHFFRTYGPFWAEVVTTFAQASGAGGRGDLLDPSKASGQFQTQAAQENPLVFVGCRDASQP